MFRPVSRSRNAERERERKGEEARWMEKRGFCSERYIVGRLLNAAASWFNKELSIAEHYVTSIHP